MPRISQPRNRVFNYIIHAQLKMETAQMEIFDWLMDVHPMRDVWRCVSMGSGEQCAMTDGDQTMLPLSAGSSVLSQMVSEVYKEWST